MRQNSLLKVNRGARKLWDWGAKQGAIFRQKMQEPERLAQDRNSVLRR